MIIKELAAFATVFYFIRTHRDLKITTQMQMGGQSPLEQEPLSKTVKLVFEKN